MEKGVSEAKLKSHKRELDKIRQEISKVVVGQENVVDGLLRGLLCNGHVLIEGVPGIAKTLIARTLAKVTGAHFSRIQFTVDLLPTDITGLTTYDERKGFYVIKGPIFADFVMADEINRAPPKTQSALLEAMQERQTTIGKETFPMNDLFFVAATQNPIEQSGTYPLPEAQIDRFLFKLLISYPQEEHEKAILEQNITLNRFEEHMLRKVTSKKSILIMQEDVKRIHLNERIKEYIVNIIDATRNPAKYRIKSGKFISYGASPRGSIGIFIAAKANAFMAGRHYTVPQDVKDIAYDVMRHRILLNYEGQAEGVNVDIIIKEILAKVKVP